MGMVTVTATSSIEDAVTITDGTGAAATTSTGTTAVIIIIIADGWSIRCIRYRHPLPGRCAHAAMRTGRAVKARPVQPALN